MDRAGRAGMALHQVLSFSPLLLRVPEAEAVFWPGCALLQLDAAVLEGTLAALARREPGIRLAAGCCGQPTACLFPEKAPKRQEKLRALLARRGVRRIYTACPNCTPGAPGPGRPAVEPVLPLLAELLRGEASPARRERCVWHDPLPHPGRPGPAGRGPGAPALERLRLDGAGAHRAPDPLLRESGHAPDQGPPKKRGHPCPASGGAPGGAHRPEQLRGLPGRLPRRGPGYLSHPGAPVRPEPVAELGQPAAQLQAADLKLHA